MIRFDGVSHSYHRHGAHGIKDLTLHIPAGDFRFIVASASEYKTTLLNLIYGRILPTTGTLRLFDEYELPRDRRRIPAIRARIGYVFNPLMLFDDLPVRDNFALPLLVKGLPDDRGVDTIVEEYLIEFGFPVPDKPASHLSTAEKQRLAFARALITRPDVLLADDPFRSMNRIEAESVMHALEERNRQGMTVVITASTPAVPKAFKKPYITMKGGRIHDDAV